MDFIKMYLPNAFAGIGGVFSAYTSCKIADGGKDDINCLKVNENGFAADYPEFSVCCEYERLENGVLLRRDCLTAKQQLTLYGYASRFVFDEGDYEVYTQFSAWQNESVGGWQNLVTAVEVANTGVRMTESATPMIALRNKNNDRITVFHLIPNAQWSIRVSRKAVQNAKWSVIVVELGLQDKGLRLECGANEKIEMPSIITYEAQNRIDLDAWKLHTVYNRLYPRKALPVIYNSWLLNFAQIDIDNIFRQADCAAELGVEMFLIDAGWFGESESWTDVGNWNENLKYGFKGKLCEVSEYIRSKGMKFGMWIESEDAMVYTDAVKQHPEYFKRDLNGTKYLLDFSIPEAREYIFEIVCALIDKYKLGYMKFDFNGTMAYDEKSEGFYRYMQGYREYIEKIRARYPDLYITNCASGGYRMDLWHMQMFDSVWVSDNQSPIDSVRIIKETAKRLPPCLMERYDVRTFRKDFIVYESEKTATLPLSCDGAAWNSVLTVDQSYTHAFMTGGVMGFSCSIADYPEEEKQALKQMIADFKMNRDFYKKAVVRILHDSDNIIVFQYSDVAFEKNVVQVFCRHICQRSLTIYPVLNKNDNYICADRSESGADFMENGYSINIGMNQAYVLEWIKK